ncbi:hypothetical protein [Antarcticirhabdus aurantiaca]|uniref:Uncharacterized protein n=1 Tax=Antarcticirhabdus aurantiaca TaxID=2606717 RepID=A0ACD4NJC9_9HYPH|nr:hypothetical protein OXU80_18630 [Jeongeuplla avenae]
MPFEDHPLLVEWDRACSRVVQAEIRYAQLSRIGLGQGADLIAAAQADLLRERAAFAAINARIAEEVKAEIGGRALPPGSGQNGD